MNSSSPDNTVDIPDQAGAGAPIDILLVDDHAIWRGGVRSMLEGTEFHVVGEASSGIGALELLRTMKERGESPRLILLDIRMAGGDGLDALASIKSEARQTAVIMLTTYDNPTYMARAIANGASGYVLKGVGREELLAAMRAVADGEMLLSRESLSRSLRGLSSDSPQAAELIQPLTDREVEVVRLLATGLSNREMAPMLFISESTVKTHVEHIIAKLGVSDRVQAAVWAARQGLVSEDS